ncbi:uncharacterized protein LOC135392568 [Ornithodoros turicata]|uniref:uncharacterized protein LOC135392568 n=1 Tax=Ornithodoros turicata TaxID=34597 RepID=UPI003139C70D
MLWLSSDPRSTWNNFGTQFGTARCKITSHDRRCSVEIHRGKSRLVEWVYERLMGSRKLALKKTIGAKFLSAHELTMYLCETEAVLNSRPLTHLYDEPQEPVPLRSASFLAGRRLTTLPNLTGPEVTNIAHNQQRKSWSDRQMVLATFWKRWSKGYLAELKTRPSTRGRKATIEEGELVLLQETMLPRQQWKMARVEQCFVGRDGKVRSCMLKLPSGITLKRRIQLLYPLELGE